MIQERLADHPNAALEIVEPVPSPAPVVGSAKEGHGRLDFASYVDQIDAVGGEFSLIVVDGRAREACLVRALDHLADGGIVVFDNTLRRRYRRAIAAAPVDERRYWGLTPTLPYPDQTSILRLRSYITWKCAAERAEIRIRGDSRQFEPVGNR